MEESHERASEAAAKLAIAFFYYDRLIHVNVHEAAHIGLRDTFVLWYPEDCDYYNRVRMEGYLILDFNAGDIFDVASYLSNPEEQLFHTRGSREDVELHHELQEMSLSNMGGGCGRNTWQG